MASPSSETRRVGLGAIEPTPGRRPSMWTPQRASVWGQAGSSTESGRSATRVTSRSRSPVSRSRSPGGSGGRASADRSRWWMSASTAKNRWSRPGKYQCSGGGAHHADAAGQRLVGLAGAGQRGVGVGADEHDGGSGALGLVAAVGEAPAAQERVVGEELVVVVGRAGGEVELDEQVEGELHGGHRAARARGRA